MHENGYAHLDISPENIMLHGSDHRPVLIDFGVAKKIRNPDINQGCWGKTRYMHPIMRLHERQFYAKMKMTDAKRHAESIE